MSRRIIVLLKPFCKEQSIYVYEDGNAIDAKEIEMKELNNQLETFIKEYNISQVVYSLHRSKFLKSEFLGLSYL